MDGECVQEQHAPNSICFGCGPANLEGLRIRSFPIENGLEMKFQPSDEHQAFPGIINGGIIGTLLDCHGNWTAAMAIMANLGHDQPPCTVTARYSVKLRRPTPHGVPLHITSQVESLEGNRAEISMSLTADGEVCAQGDGLFVAVKEGHPAWHRWH
ncbi:MAG: hotdog fold domain-containing protein [Candidatus Thermoplasmatota archaeon]|nr:hotdog fold domain-containing protein [Candidatus Thermoplasmatota archaeon]